MIKKWENALNGQIENSNTISDIPDIDRNISLDEIRNALHKLKLRKACGYDVLPNEVLKTGNISDALCSLFNCCFKGGLIPSDWNKIIHSQRRARTPKFPKTLMA